MKILLSTLEYPPHQGGVANYYYNLKKYWPEKDKFLVINNNDNELLCKRKLPLRWIKSLFSIYNYYKKNKIDYLLVGQILPLGTTALILKILFNINYGVVIHGMDFSYALKSKRKAIITKIILKKATNIISANTYTKDLVLSKFSKLNKKISVVNPGVEVEKIDIEMIEKIKTEYNLENKIIIYSLGRLVKRKGFDNVIKAINSLDKNIKKKIVYVISGTGFEMNNLKKQAENKDFNIIFTDSISNTEKWSWLNLCDIFVMPSRNINGDFEGFGIVFLEAALNSSPAISSLSGGIKDAIEDGSSGYLVKENNINALAKKIEVLVNNEKLRDEMGNYAYTRAKEKFNWSKQAQLFYNILNK
ncbi:glycosyltransferase family 4 protein [Patescibacteria group bacterium]|nr:glycosyltransferase family 4 protein [Patescibacteria group bacterium]